ncbi:hypothetical protein P4117_31075 [Pseudomonas aeruginosa]|nr:hypothetical protein [Pseudomonas aeruginosa]
MEKNSCLTLDQFLPEASLEVNGSELEIRLSVPQAFQPAKLAAMSIRSIGMAEWPRLSSATTSMHSSRVSRDGGRPNTALA